MSLIGKLSNRLNFRAESKTSQRTTDTPSISQSLLDEEVESVDLSNSNDECGQF